MHDRCSFCDLKFEREPGYFLGAMYFSYALGLVIIALIAALLWSVTGWWITKDTIWAVVLFLPLAPTITLFARVLDLSRPDHRPRTATLISFCDICVRRHLRNRLQFET